MHIYIYIYIHIHIHIHIIGHSNARRAHQAAAPWRCASPLRRRSRLGGSLSPSHGRGTLKWVPTVKSPNSHF